MKPYIYLCLTCFMFAFTNFSGTYNPIQESCPSTNKLTPTWSVPCQNFSEFDEISGVYFHADFLWAISDNKNILFKIDPVDGTLKQKIDIDTPYKCDWEEITGDGQYLYIGATGNNDTTKRSCYKSVKTILRISINSISQNTPSVKPDTLHFQYDTNGKKYDCEAIAVKDKEIHLFTKSIGTSLHFTLDKTAFENNYIMIAKPQDTLDNCNLQITGAAIKNNSLVLIGYQHNSNRDPQCGIFLYDFSKPLANTGNWRYLGREYAIGQMEAITFNSDKTFIVVNEHGDVPIEQRVIPTIRQYSLP